MNYDAAELRVTTELKNKVPSERWYIVYVKQINISIKRQVENDILKAQYKFSESQTKIRFFFAH